MAFYCAERDCVEPSADVVEGSFGDLFYVYCGEFPAWFIFDVVDGFGAVFYSFVAGFHGCGFVGLGEFSRVGLRPKVFAYEDDVYVVYYAPAQVFNYGSIGDVTYPWVVPMLKAYHDYFVRDRVYRQFFVLYLGKHGSRGWGAYRWYGLFRGIVFLIGRCCFGSVFRVSSSARQLWFLPLSNIILPGCRRCGGKWPLSHRRLCLIPSSGG